MSTDFWQQYASTREHMCGWWEREELVVILTAPKATPTDLPAPTMPEEIAQRWLDPAYRLEKALYDMQNTYYGADAFPIYEAHLGPGNLATFVGSLPDFDERTVWFHPCLPDPPESAEALEFDPQNEWFLAQRDIVELGQLQAKNRFLVGMPDMVENIDTYASLRGTQLQMMDFYYRPAYMLQMIQEINQVWFKAFDEFYDLIKDEYGGNAWTYFNIYGPGKTGKVQCDASAMFSPQMFEEFVVPGLTEQCDWLDYSMFHLDGTQCLVHLDHLLNISSLTAIEWTPDPSQPFQAGHPEWYSFYRQVLEAGKAVHAWWVDPEYVVPLLDAVGGNGMLLVVKAENEEQARRLEEEIEQFRN